MTHPAIAPRPSGLVVMSDIAIFYLTPTKDGYWCVTRHQGTGRVFQIKQFALDYAREVAEMCKPSVLVELTIDGDEMTLERFG